LFDAICFKRPFGNKGSFFAKSPLKKCKIILDGKENIFKMKNDIFFPI